MIFWEILALFLFQRYIVFLEFMVKALYCFCFALLCLIMIYLVGFLDLFQIEKE